MALLVSESKNASRSAGRIETGVPAERTDGGPAGTPAWVKLVRSGPQVEVFQSDNGLTWTSIGTAPIATSGEVYVANTGSPKTPASRRGPVIDNLSIEPASILPRRLTLPPLVSLTWPIWGNVPHHAPAPSP